MSFYRPNLVWAFPADAGWAANQDRIISIPPKKKYILCKKGFIMSKKEALHQLYAQCQKINFDESYDIIASASDPDEANFFRTVTDLILKQKQKKVIEANRF